MHRRSLSNWFTPLVVLVVASVRPAAADWPPDGVSLCGVGICYAPGGVLVAADGVGGAFVVWPDDRSGTYDVYAQHVTSAGEIADGWPPAGGLPVCANSAPRFVNAISPDGHGGLLITWSDHRDMTGATRYDIYAQRVMADGSIPTGWAVDGMPATRASGDQVRPVILADGSGGAFVSWTDDATENIYLQHLTAAGVPAPGWPDNGRPVCVDQSLQGSPLLAADGSGGALIAWGDLRDGPPAVYAQRVLADGSIAPGWVPNGMLVTPGRAIRGLVSDGAGGAYVSCGTFTFFSDDDYYLQRFTGEGTVAPGWPEGGVPVCLAPDDRVSIGMVGDGAGGALLVWSDYRGLADDDIFASRHGPDGALAPGWPVDGMRVTDDTHLDDEPDLAPDGAGGVFLTWTKYASATGDRIFVQHLTGAGEAAAGWPAGGRIIPTDAQARRSGIVPDGQGGAIVAWEHGDQTVRALRFPADSPTPVLVSLVSAEVEEGRVRIEWYAPQGQSLVAEIERRTETSEWQRLGSITPDGGGRMRYEDRAVIAGTRYSYRLAYADASSLAHTAETWVTVPALRFALRGLTPNPSAGDPVVAFSLTSDDPTTLEFYDPNGRLVLVREVGTLGAGSHSLRLDAGSRLRAGVYAIRLRQGARVATARAVMVR